MADTSWYSLLVLNCISKASETRMQCSKNRMLKIAYQLYFESSGFFFAFRSCVDSAAVANIIMLLVVPRGKHSRISTQLPFKSLFSACLLDVGQTWLLACFLAN